MSPVDDHQVEHSCLRNVMNFDFPVECDTIEIEIKKSIMVKLTVDLIVKQIPGLKKRRPDESVDYHLSRLTHLPVQHRMIDSIDVIPPCRSLTVIYLYENFLTKIENLNFAENLTHLYLQNNRLNKLENLHSLTKLKKLYLAGNQIHVLEGLEWCRELIELHIENQRLAEGEKLLFDPRTIESLANILEVFNVSGNHLDSIVELNLLGHLREFIATNNNLTDIRELIQFVRLCPSLKCFDLSRNPVCCSARYRERLIVVGDNLEMLDGKVVTNDARRFLVCWKASRDALQSREKSKSDIVTSNRVDDIPSGVSFFLPHIRSGVTRTRSMIFSSRADFRRNLIKADLTLMKREPISLDFPSHTPRKAKFEILPRQPTRQHFFK